MIASMLHEPFYQCGTHGAPEMGIYAGWVAHENSFTANQVFLSADGNLALLVSGECFLDSETEALLRRRGRTIDRNNGAWLIDLYLESGDRFFAQLNGLLSGLLIDKKRNSAFLFNDRYGIERIYWHETADAVYFASEAKALLRVVPELRRFDQTGLVEFLTYGCTLGSRTLFCGIQSLPSASLWRFDGGTRQEQKYFSPAKWESQSAIPAKDFVAEFEETFNRILPRYLQPDSKLGISLTAGLDGRMIMACLPMLAEKPICYTFSGQIQDTLDARIAARVAAACGFEHQTLRIGPDFLCDFATHADRTVFVTDGCLSVTGSHEIYMNRQARVLAPVRLTGVFGGEIFREVSFSRPLGLDSDLVNREFVTMDRLPKDGFNRNDQNPVTFAISQEIPQLRFGVIAAGRSQTTFRTPYLDNELVALAYRVPPELRGSPAPGWSLIEHNSDALAEIPTDMGQTRGATAIAAIARRVLGRLTFKLDYFHSEGLPDSLSKLDPAVRMLNTRIGIRGLHKYLDYRGWFQRELAGYVHDGLAYAQEHQAEIWNGDFLNQIACGFRGKQRKYTAEINCVLTLSAIDRTLFRGAETLIPRADREPDRTTVYSN